MNYTFPATVFVTTNTQKDQLRHVVSEMAEVMDAIVANNGMIVGEVEQELMDLTHTLETFWRMRSIGRCAESAVEELVIKTIRKNSDRGYYGG